MGQQKSTQRQSHFFKCIKKDSGVFANWGCVDGGVGEVELKREQDFLRKPRTERRQLGSKEVTLQDCLKEVAKAVVESSL